MARLVRITQKMSMDLYEASRDIEEKDLQVLVARMGAMARKLKVETQPDKDALVLIMDEFDPYERQVHDFLNRDKIAAAYWLAYSLWCRGDKRKYYIPKDFYRALAETNAVFHRDSFGDKPQSFVFALPKGEVIDSEDSEYHSCIVQVAPFEKHTKLTIIFDDKAGHLTLQATQLQFNDKDTLDDALKWLKKETEAGRADAFKPKEARDPKYYSYNECRYDLDLHLRAILNAVHYVSSSSADLRILPPLPKLDKKSKREMTEKYEGLWNPDRYPVVLLNWAFRFPSFHGTDEWERKGHFWWKPHGKGKKLRSWEWRNGSTCKRQDSQIA